MPKTTVIIDSKTDFIRLLQAIDAAGIHDGVVVRVVWQTYHVTLPEGLSPQDYAALMEGIPYRIEGAA